MGRLKFIEEGHSEEDEDDFAFTPPRDYFKWRKPQPLEEMSLMGLVYKSRDNFSALNYARRMGLKDNPTVVTALEEDRKLGVLIAEKLKKERITEKLFGLESSPAVLDYCFSEFCFTLIDAKEESNVYSPFQVVSKVEEFMEYIKNRNGKKYSFYGGDHRLEREGLIASGCFLKYDPENAQRSMLFKNRKGEEVLVNPLLFYSQGFDYYYDSYTLSNPSRVSWSGRRRTDILSFTVHD